MIDLGSEFEIKPGLRELLSDEKNLAAIHQASTAVLAVEVPANHAAILINNGKVERLLEPGKYAFWKYNRHVAANIVDMRQRHAEVAGQEILTSDKVSIRVNLGADYVVKDAMKCFGSVSSYTDFAYKTLQFGLREAIGTRTLDQVLSDKEKVMEDILAYAKPKIEPVGIELLNVGLKDIILPGEMKEILNKVVEAQKQAEANNIRRREETAATRSLHNTAKLMENNPTLVRLKELETLERITEKVDKISVHNGLQGILSDLLSGSGNGK